MHGCELDVMAIFLVRVMYTYGVCTLFRGTMKDTEMDICGNTATAAAEISETTTTKIPARRN